MSAPVINDNPLNMQPNIPKGIFALDLTTRYAPLLDIFAPRQAFEWLLHLQKPLLILGHRAVRPPTAGRLSAPWNRPDHSCPAHPLFGKTSTGSSQPATHTLNISRFFEEDEA